MEKLLAKGFRKQIKEFALSDKCSGPWGAVLLDLTASVKQVDIDNHRELLIILFESDLTMGLKQFERGFSELNVLFDYQLASRNCFAQWARWEAAKINCLYDYAFRSVRRPGTSRCVAINDLRRVLAEKHEVTSCHSIDSDGSDLEQPLPHCPLTPESAISCMDISDSDHDTGDNAVEFSFAIRDLLPSGEPAESSEPWKASTADGGADVADVSRDELMALADDVLDVKGLKRGGQQDRASRRGTKHIESKQSKTTKRSIKTIVKAKESTIVTPSKKDAMERLDTPEKTFRKSRKQPPIGNGIQKESRASVCWSAKKKGQKNSIKYSATWAPKKENVSCVRGGEPLRR